MDTTDNLNLPYILPSQAQKHVTHNEAIRALDALVQLAVADRDQSAPPADPANGDRHIVASGATGDWAGRDGNVAAFQDGAWAFFIPQMGWRAWIEAEAALFVWNGTLWTSAGAGGAGGVNPVDFVGVNATADAANRLAVSSPAALFNHEGAGHQIKINKALAADTASVLFQTGFSGRAEFGLTGDDDWHVKVSPDGTSWNEAIVAAKDTGHLGLGGAPQADARLTIDAAAITKAIEIVGTNDPFVQIVDTSTASSGRFRIFGSDLYLGLSNAGKVFFFTSNVTAGSVEADRGLVWGSPTGGSKGVGTINAQGVYDDNLLLSCYVFDAYLDGAVDEAKWNARVPDRVVKARRADEDVAAATEKREVRRHEPMEKFLGRLGTGYDPLTLDGYARHWKERRHLSAMPNEASFDPEAGEAVGSWVQKLLETVEIQAVLIEELNERTKRQEDRIAALESV